LIRKVSCYRSIHAGAIDSRYARREFAVCHICTSSGISWGPADAASANGIAAKILPVNARSPPKIGSKSSVGCAQ
jgi:hypothetical protein